LTSILSEQDQILDLQEWVKKKCFFLGLRKKQEILKNALILTLDLDPVSSQSQVVFRVESSKFFSDRVSVEKNCGFGSVMGIKRGKRRERFRCPNQCL